MAIQTAREGPPIEQMMCGNAHDARFRIRPIEDPIRRVSHQIFTMYRDKSICVQYYAFGA
jgi:hypothetical protein